MDVWGSMPADLLFLSHDGQTVSMVENKVSRGFTYTNHPQNQLDRQIAFLANSKISWRFLILLSGSDFFVWLAICYFVHDSLGFPVLLRSCDVQCGRVSRKREVTAGGWKRQQDPVTVSDIDGSENDLKAPRMAASVWLPPIERDRGKTCKA